VNKINSKLKVVTTLIALEAMMSFSPAVANPEGGIVVDGNAQIVQTSASRLDINQSTDSAIINWNSFSLAQDEHVNFNQPTSSSLTLNRVMGSDLSRIAGKMTANGRIMLVNPNGILFTPTARIDVDGMLTTVSNISDENFKNKNFNFDISSSIAEAGILNQGQINTRGGMALLVAKSVKNEGTITNQGGTTALVSANKFKLSFIDSSDIRIQVDESVLSTLENVSNLVDITGNVISQGGNIILQANIADTVLNNAVNTSGVVVANTIKEENGKIVLGSIDLIAQNGSVTTGGTISATGEKGGNITVVSSFAGLGGTIDASGNEGGNISVSTGVLSLAENIKAIGNAGKGGNIVFNASKRTWETSTSKVDVSGYEGGYIYHQANEQIISSGNYFANGSVGAGGNIDITAPALKFLSTKINANGASLGGSIRLGGEYQGGKDILLDEMPNALSLAMTSSTEVNANGLTGGQIICWADQNAFVLGDFSAKGTLSGGFIEISSGDTLTFGGTADAGVNGTFLLDPKNITIAEPNVSQYPIIMGYNYVAQNANNINASTDYSCDLFASSVSINDNRLVIGAPGDDGLNNTKVNTGAVYLYTLDDASFAGGQLAGIIGYGYTGGNNINQTLENYDQFGRSVSLDGTSLAVGVPYDDGLNNPSGYANSGAVYLYTFDALDFTGGELLKIIGKNYEINQGIGVDDRFGSAVSLDGTRLAVGAYLDDGYNNPSGYADSGCVYLYNFDDTSFSGGTLAKRIGKSYEINLELGAADYFGMALSLSGNSLAIGVPYDDGLNNPSGYTDSGAVYLYTFTDSSFGGGTLVKRIGKNYEISPAVKTNDRFGYSVALNGTALAVGTPYDDGNLNGFNDTGAIYLYNFTNTSFSGGTLLKRIGKNYEINQSLDNSDYFGFALSLDGSKLATGVYYDDGYNNLSGDSGAVYIYSFLDSNFGGGSLSQIVGVGYPASNSVAQVLNDSGGDQFGRAISLDGNRLVVGASNINDITGTRVNTGAVYLYTFTDDSFSNVQLEGIIGDGYTGGKNINLTLDTNDYFGVSASLDGQRLAVGALGDDANSNITGGSGAVYLFTFADSSFSGGSLIKKIGKNYELNQTLDGDDGFGISVSLEANRLAVAALYDDGLNNPSGYANSGAVYLYTFDDLNFTGGTLVKRIGKNYDVNVSLDATDYFGTSVSLDGTRLAVGAQGDDGSVNSTYLTNAGGVYLFNFDDLNFSGGTLAKRIGAGYEIDPNIDANDIFGYSVSISGNTLAVGTHGDDGAGNLYSDAGAVYIYNFDDANFSGGTLAQKIGRDYAYDTLLENGDNFGVSVSLDGTRLAVGTIGDDGYLNLAGSGGTGSVYLYNFTDTTYSSGQLLRVIGSTYTDTNSVNTPVEVGNSQFGRSVSLDGNMLVVGENNNDGLTRQYENYGAVYMYTFADSSFTGGQLAGIIGNGYTGGKNINQSLQAGDAFGTSVSLDGNRLVVGAPYNNSYLNYKTDAGAVYLYTFTDSSFSGGQLAGIIGDGYTADKSINQALDSSDLFGYAVSLDGNRLAVGAVYEDGYNNPSGYSNSGAVYLYNFTNSDFSSGTLVKRIGKNYDINQTLESGDQFGWGVSLSGTGLAVGISLDDGNANALTDSGAVFLYKFDDLNFTGGSLVKTIGKGYNIDLALGGSDRFGYSVSLDGTRLAIGAVYDDGYNNPTADSGCVYLYTFDNTSFGTGTLVKQIGRNYGVNLVLDTYDSFGTSVSLDGTRLAIGAMGDDGYLNVATNTGNVYLYTFTDLSFGGGTLAGTIGANYTGGKNVNEYLQFNDYGDQFGRAVALDGNRLVVGENLNDGLNNSAWASGAVYMYTFDDASFTGGQLAGIIGNGYSGGNNINQALEVNDQFGSSVSLEGTHLVVGAPYDDGLNNSRTDSGAVYLYNFDDTDFSGGELVKRIGDGYEVNLTLGASDYFGWGVSLDGINLAVGAPYDDGYNNPSGFSNAGAVYLYQFSNTDFGGGTLLKTVGKSYTLDQALEASDCFGWSVSLDGTKLAVGAVYDDGFNNPSGYSSSGAVYIYSFGDTSFTGGALVNTIGKNYNINQALDVDDNFGYSVSLSGTRLAVGAIYEDGSGNGYGAAGAVFLYNFTDSTLTSGSLTKRIGTAYEINPLLEGSDYFGSAVSLDGNRIAIGAFGDDGYSPFNASAFNLGAVYLYTFSDENFNNPNQAGIIGSGYLGYKAYNQNINDFSDEFGYSVALDGNRLVVGERFNDGYNNSSYNSGAVYLYTYTDDMFSSGQLAGIIGNGYSGGKNINQPLEYNDNFGWSVSLDGTRLVVGAPYDDGLNNVAYNTGAVYLYNFTDSEFSGGTLIKTIGSGYSIDPGLGNSDLFGTAVSLDGERLAVGVAYDDGLNNVSTNSGDVYLYKFDDLNFTGGSLVKRIGKNYEVNQSLESSDYFGWSVSLDGTRLAVGALEDDGFNNPTGYSASGAVYLFGFDDLNFTGGALLQTIGKGYAIDQSLDANDNFGTAVALNGTSLAVGVQYDDGNNNIVTNRGAVYLYTFDNTNFSNVTSVNKMGYLETTNVALDINYDYFGTSLAIDGNRMAVGAKGDDGYQNIAGSSTTSDYRTGGVYLYTFSDSNFTAPVLNSIIGMSYSSLKSINVNLDGGASNFGYAVSLDGNRLAIGEYCSDGFNNSSFNSGSVSLYSFTNQYYNGAVLEGIIGNGYTGGKNINQTLEANDYFGTSVSLDDNRLVVGAQGDDGYLNVTTDSGAVYLYTFADSTFSGGSLVKTIGRSYTIDQTLDSSDIFGYAVSLDGTKLAVGVPGDDGYNNPSGYGGSGAVYIYNFDDLNFSGGTLIKQIGKGYGIDADLGPDDQFGFSVSLDGTRMAVGAFYDDASDNSITNAGAVYLYKFDDSSLTSGNLVKRMGMGYEVNVTLEAEDRFGSAVSLDGTRIAVGAYYDDGNANIYGNSGAVYLYSFSDMDFGGGTLEKRIGKNYEVNLAVGGSDYLGRAVSLDANRLAIGAYGDDGYQDAVSNSGAVYLYYIDNGTVYQSDLFASRANKDVTLFGSTLASLLSTGQNITLQANNDITLNTDISVNNSSGNGGIFTLQAGRSILLNGNITSDSGNVNIIANDQLSSGVVDSQRDSGAAVITMGTGKSINAGTGSVNIELKDGAGKTYTDSGDITLGNVQAGSILVQNKGLTTGSDILINSGTALTASSTGNSLILNTVNGNFINNSGASALSASLGRWLVYSSDPSATTKGSLTAGKIYNKTYLVNNPGSIAAGNYFLYSISPSLTITAGNNSRLYGDVDPVLTGSVTGYIDGDTFDTALGGSLAYTPASNILSGIGSYDITPSAVSSLGYTLNYVNGTLTINKAHLTVSADNKSKTYFDDNPVLTASLTGFKNGENTSVVSGSALLETTSAKTSNVGSYSITSGAGTLSASNYDFIGFNSGTLTINKAHLTVGADNKTRLYGDANPIFTASYTGFLNGETVSVTSGTPALTTPANLLSGIGNYSINSGLGTLSATNYDFIGFNSGTLTINKAHLTVSADNKSKTYFDDNPLLTASLTGFKNGENVSIVSGSALLGTTAVKTTNVGSYSITSGLGTLSASNYDFIGFNPGTLTINKALLNITADDKTRIYGAENPILTASYAGFVNNESTANIDGTLSLVTSATKDSISGNYAIVPSGHTAENYNIVYNNGILAIRPPVKPINQDDALIISNINLEHATDEHIETINKNIDGSVVTETAVSSSVSNLPANQEQTIPPDNQTRRIQVIAEDSEYISVFNEKSLANTLMKLIKGSDNVEL
jgi:filamentous hemagglutinin family protein